MKRLPFWFLSGMAAALLAQPAWAADGSCSFRAAGLSLDFGTLNPSRTDIPEVRAPLVILTTFANQAGDCKTGNMTVSVSGGNSRQMSGGGADGTGTINYTIVGLPVTLPKPGNAPPGNPAAGYSNWFTANQIEGVIQWSAFADAPAGFYTDSFTVVVNP
jgi:hypothetical protein